MKKIQILLSAVLATCSIAGTKAATPYITRVYEYCPAPGQFINEIPEYEEGDDYETILGKAEEALCGSARPGLVSLGAFGGYITFGFDHRIANKQGDYDFRVNGNAIISDRNNGGGSCEPGIILVSVDTNGNGLPDDEWYEIKGSEYDNPETLRGYKIVYYRPSSGHQAQPDPSDKHIVDMKYIRWTSNDASAAEGYLQRNDNHSQSYWPQWLDEGEETLTFSGSRLPSNSFDVNGDGTYFVLKMLGEGYADNYPSVLSGGFVDPGVKIDWAVKSDGTPANLDGIDFVRVYTAMNQTCGWIGETSTEVSGAEDLHPGLVSVAHVKDSNPAIVLLKGSSGRLALRSGYDVPVRVSLTDLNGMTRGVYTLLPGDNGFDVRDLVHGVYLLSGPDNHIFKLIL